MSSQTQINKLAERYPFDDEELEQLIRCHAALLDTKNTDSFLTKMAMSSPYSYYFLPGNEMRRRIELIEDKIVRVMPHIKREQSIKLVIDNTRKESANV